MAFPINLSQFVMSLTVGPLCRLEIEPGVWESMPKIR